MTGSYPTNQITLYLLRLFYSDNEILTVHCRPAICTLIGWIEISHLCLSFNKVSWVHWYELSWATPVYMYLYPLPFTLLRIVWFVFLRWTDWWSCLAQIISNILWEYAFIFQFLSFSTHISLSKLWNIHFAICEARGLLLEVPFKDIFQDLCHLDEG